MNPTNEERIIDTLTNTVAWLSVGDGRRLVFMDGQWCVYERVGVGKWNPSYAGEDLSGALDVILASAQAQDVVQSD